MAGGQFLFERPRGGERAVLVHLEFQGENEREELDEFRELVRSAGAEVADIVTGSRRMPDARYFLGSGKAEEVRDRVAASSADLVIVNHNLAPSQERNLEKLCGCRVVDRTGLILDIFAQRARSHEGKLQVELAQLKHLATRLVRGWTHLERQKGGIGLRGPGETQLESDRRLVRNRIKQLNTRLEKVDRQRDQSRRARRRATLPTISLVGYTNAGKSTLFNRITGSQVFAADQLFATLDPTVRRIRPVDDEPMLLADTVGFIRHLPHDLVAAFRSTLQETAEADLLLHVIDAAAPERDALIEQVHTVLVEIGAEDIPQIEVFNKIDLVTGAEPRIERDADGVPVRVWVSAVTGAGMELLRDALAERVRSGRVRRTLRLSPSAGRLRAQLYDQGAVRAESVTESGEWVLDLDLPRGTYEKLIGQSGVSADPPVRAST